MQISFQIRKANPEDGKAILICLAAAFEKHRAEYSPEAFADTVLDSETIQLRLRAMQVLVAVSEGRIVGTLGYTVHGTEGHLRGMAVHPDSQGTSVAAALLETAEADLVRLKCTYATLDTTQPLKRAIRFYERHGFSPSGHVSDFFGMNLYEYAKPLVSLPGTEGEVIP
ncbi:MAG: GNAT family N-acetyltransferase [Terracidiphilus sp.]